MFLYPLAIVLIVLSLCGKFFGHDRRVYRWVIGFTFFSALYDLLDLSGKALSMATQPVGVEPAGSPNAKVPEQSEPAEQEPTSTITPDEITKAAVALIKRDRKNSVKIQALLKTYGVSQMSVLDPAKYETFMVDLQALDKG